MTGFLGTRLRRNEALTAKLGPIRVTRCSGRDHIDLTAGALHYALYRRSMPWDHAAGALLHAEAGGYNAGYDGEPYSPARPPEQGILLAPDRDSWRALHALTEPAFRG
jgi:fructose-1,6-bisphosphatase/inositol monophosphatase family enzyme